MDVANKKNQDEDWVDRWSRNIAIAVGRVWPPTRGLANRSFQSWRESPAKGKRVSIGIACGVIFLLILSFRSSVVPFVHPVMATSSPDNPEARYSQDGGFARKEAVRQQRDAELRSMLIGTWHGFQPASSGGYHNIYTFNPDGTFSSSPTGDDIVTKIGGVIAGSLQGKWYIYNQKLTTEFTSGTNGANFVSKILIGHPTTDEIRVQDSDQFVKVDATHAWADESFRRIK